MNRFPGTLHVAILAFEEVEALDLAGPYEVFTTASRMALRTDPSAAPPFKTSCVARTREAVRARAGMAIVPNHGFVDAPPTDILIVPGGVVNAVMTHQGTLEWIAKTHANTLLTASVCTGAFLLAASGVLTDGPVTTHWEDHTDLKQQFPTLEVQSGKRWVDQGKLITSGGISAGIDMSLYIVSRLMSEALALRTAKQMEFQWTHNP
jgi:transcriptional regulator GlxA family with amidase domain